MMTRIAEDHNVERFPHQDATRVTKGRSLEHLMSQLEDKKHLRYERPWYPLLYDRDERHWKDRHYYLVSVGLILASAVPLHGNLLLLP